jgi:hypothetical protein
MSSRQLKVCNNPVSTYVLSDILHFLSYLYAFYVFRWCENEELSTTMEKTFLQTTSTKRRGYLSQGKLTKDIRAILVLGVFWIVLQFLASLIVVIGRLLDCRVTAKGNVGFSAWIFTEKDMK